MENVTVMALNHMKKFHIIPHMSIYQPAIHGRKEKYITNNMYCIFNIFFRLSTKVQRWSVKHSENSILKQYKIIVFFICLLLLVLFAATNAIFLGYLFLAAFLSWYVMNLVTASFIMLSSIRGFFKNAFSFSVVLFVLLLLLLVPLENVLSNTVGTSVAGIIILVSSLLIACLIWSFISCCADTSVSILANAILTGLVGIVSQICNYLLLFLPSNIAVNLPIFETFVNEMGNYGYTVTQALQLAVNTLFFPIAVILGVATIICALKKYWITKYNDGQDLIAYSKKSEAHKPST
ncbi:hypothetical protein [Ethanoligenens harbinense]|nr:hypothetical protein [Ethanoligenens harbinense]